MILQKIKQFNSTSYEKNINRNIIVLNFSMFTCDYLLRIYKISFKFLESLLCKPISICQSKLSFYNIYYSKLYQNFFLSKVYIYKHFSLRKLPKNQISHSLFIKIYLVTVKKLIKDTESAPKQLINIQYKIDMLEAFLKSY